MIEKDEVLAVLGTDEGQALVCEYTELFLKSEYPDHVSDEAYIKNVLLAIVEVFSKKTVPEGADTHRYVLDELKTTLDELKSENTASPAAESIPLRPLPNGSRYLNPEEVNWLLKYDPKVKSSAERFVNWFRKEHGDSCSNMSDGMIVKTILETLYKLNRRDPSILEQLPGAGPSFFKQYEEGTPEEIVIRYFDSYSGKSDDSAKPTSSDPIPRTTDSTSKEELIKQRRFYNILGVVFLFLFWPLSCYFFYEASQISKKLKSL